MISTLPPSKLRSSTEDLAGANTSEVLDLSFHYAVGELLQEVVGLERDHADLRDMPFSQLLLPVRRSSVWPFPADLRRDEQDESQLKGTRASAAQEPDGTEDGPTS